MIRIAVPTAGVGLEYELCWGCVIKRNDTNRSMPFLQSDTTCCKIHAVEEAIAFKHSCSGPSKSGPSQYCVDATETSREKAAEQKYQDSISPKRQGRAILSEDQARMIFKHKPSPFAKDRGRAGALARAFGVSVKTIRDVWIGRTWCRATLDLTPDSQSDDSSRLHKKAGRPLGPKDSKPRMRKVTFDFGHGIDDGAVCKKHVENMSTTVGGSSFNADEEFSDFEHIPTIDQTLNVPTCEDVPKGQSPTEAVCTLAPETKSEVEATHGCDFESINFNSWLSRPIASSDADMIDPFRDDWPFWKHLNVTPSRSSFFQHECQHQIVKTKNAR